VRRFKIGMLRFGPVVTLAVFLCAMATLQARGEQRRSDMLVTTEWLAGHLQDWDLIVLCVAEGDPFYSSGHIPGSRLLRLSDIVTTREGVPNQLPAADVLQKAFQADGVNNDSRIVLYGERSGVLAARAYFTLDYLGLADRAALLDGGIEKWRAEGRQQSTDTPRIAATSLRIRLHPEIVVNTPQVAEYSHTGPSNVVLLDARPPLEYSGERLSENVSQAGHIPSARSLYWKELLREGDIPELRSEQELRTRFEDAGATSAKEVITYCRTGMQSSFDYFVLKYLGYPARMYVGSFYEWTRAPRSTEVKAFCH
jgi:thiosulfate/3-mercaptopyruvate sulfurtransferase